MDHLLIFGPSWAQNTILPCLFTFYNFNREIDALAYFRPLGIGEPVTILTEFLNHILVWIAGKY